MKTSTWRKEDKNPDGGKEAEESARMLTPDEMSDFLQGEREWIAAGTEDVIERSKRIADRNTPQGRQATREAEWAAHVAGTPTRVLGVPKAAVKDESPTGDAPVQEQEQVKASGQSPVPHGVVYEDGKPRTEWVLPDGSLTTSRMDAEHAEYAARQARDEQRLADRMRTLGLDPEQPEDVQTEYLLKEKRRIEAEMGKRGKELDVESAGFSWRDMPRGGGALVHTYNSTTVNGRLADPAYKALTAQLHQVNEGLAVLDASKRNKAADRWIDDSSNWAARKAKQLAAFGIGSWRGLAHAVGKVSTWDMGMTDMANNAMLYQAATDADRQGIDNISQEERDLLNLAANTNAIQAKYGKDLGYGYAAGNITGESLPFMMEFILNPASRLGQTAVNRMMRVAVERYGKAAVKAAAKKYLAAKIGTRVAGDIAGAAVMAGTTGQGRVTADMLNRMTGDVQFREDGNGRIVYDGREGAEDSMATALLKAFGAQTIENHSEMLGTYFAPILGKAAKLGRKGMEKIGLGKVNRLIDDLGATNAARMLDDFKKRTRWNGTVEEYAEEVAGGIENALLVGDNTLDTEEGRGVFNREENIKTFLGVGLMGGFLAGAKMVSYRGPKRRALDEMSEAGKAIDSALEGNYPLMEQWGKWRNTFLIGTDEEKESALREVMNNEELPWAFRKGVLGFVKAAQKYEGLSRAQENKVENGEQEPAARMYDASYDTGYETTDPEGMEAVRSRMEAERKRLAEILGLDNPSEVDGHIGDPLGFVEEQRKLGDEERVQAAVDYANARSAYEGMVQRMRDDIDGRIEQSNRIVDERTNHDTGMIQGIIMKIQDENHNDRRGYVLSGNLVMLPDGTGIDHDKSDGSIIVRDADTGAMEMVSPEVILRMEQPVDPETEKMTAAEAIRQQYGQQEADRIDGRVAQASPSLSADEQTGSSEQPEYALNYGVTLRNDDGSLTEGIVVDANYDDGYMLVQIDTPQGERVIPYSREELDNRMQEVRNEDGHTLWKTGEASGNSSTQNSNSEPQIIPASDETLQAGASVWSALERIPKDKQGQPLYEQTDPETAWDAIVEQTGGDEEIVGEVVADLVEEQDKALKAAEKELKKVQEGKPQQKKGDAPLTMDERIAAKKVAKEQLSQAQANVDVAKKRLAIWRNIANTPIRRKQAALAAQSKAAEEAAQLRRAEEEKLRAEREEAERIRREALNGVPDFIEDTPQDARARGYRRVNGNKVDRQQAIPAKQGNEVQVKFDDNNIPTGHVALIDASQLQPSHINGLRNPLHFIDEAQPKERNDEASVMSARKIAANIRPEEITSSVTAYTGAPTVNSRGEVIQGNNRSAALREMWAAHLEQAARYKQYLTEHATDFGLTPEDVETMQQPVLVNMLDVTDDEAITLGQFVAQDTESGGTERIKPKNIVQKMGNDMRSFAGQLLASPDEEMSFAELVDRNGPGVLKWMQQKGYITPTQYKSAFDSKGGLTAETKNDLKGVMYQSIFQNGNTHLEEMFNALPVKAQKAILATAYRDYDSPNAERMNAEIQDSINAYYALSQDVAFAGAKNYKEARMAAEAWKRQLAFDDVTGESYLPSERFSNFALLLATMYKGQSQMFIQNTLGNIFDLVQGTQETTLFDEPDNTPRTLVEAINKTLSNLREELLLNGNFIYNGQRRSNVLAVGSAAGQQGRQGSDGSAPAGGRGTDAARADDSSGRTEISGEQGQAKGSDNSQLEGNSSSKQEEYTLSSKQSGNGEHFYQDASGNIDLVDIPQEVFDEIGYSKAPFRLTPSMILHVLNGHGKELGVSTVEDTVRFVLDVMTHFDHVRLGYDGALIFSIENGRKRTGKRAVTILINSDNGKFYGLKTSGYETVNGLSKRPLLWERGAKKESSTTDAASASVSTGKSPLSGEQSGSASHQSKSHSKNDEAHILHATDEQSAETVGASQEVEQSGTTTSSRMNAPASNIVPETPVKTEPQQPNNAVSTGSSLSENERGGITSSEPNGKPTVSFHKETDKSSVTQIIGEKIAKTEEETEQREAELASRVEVSDDDWQEGDTDKPIYKRSIIIDGKHTATQVDQPDENGHYTGSYFVFDNKRFGDIAEIVDYIDNGQALATKIAQAEAETNTEPTERQKEAGNYKKGHVRIGQFDITVENPKGSVRRGVDASGKAWEHTMQNTYGYIRGTEGVDGDHIDVFLTNDIDGWNGRRVYIVDQYNEDGTFDEHKVMLGFNDEADAQDAYLSNYEKGWEYKHKLVMSSVNLPDFEKWINSSHRKTKPFAEYKSVNKANVANETNAPEAGFEIAPTQYTTKRGKVLDMFLVTFAEPLTKEQQRAAKELAKAEKGWYDRDKGGFMMRSEESARKLADTITGNEEVVSNAQPLSIADIRKLEEPAMRQVDVEGLMQAIRENGEAKLSEHHVPQSEQKEDISTRETQSNPKNSGQFGFVSDERMEEIKRRLKMKRGQLNMGLDPETMLLGIELTLGYIDRGIKKFADYAKVMIDEVGNEYRPYLKMFYNGVRESPEAQESGLADEMTPYDEVRTFDVANFDKGHSDALATAEMVVQEQEVNRQADEAKEKLIEQRNEQRRKEDEQTTADTEAIAGQAKAVASQAESDIKATTTEQQVNKVVERIDQQLEEVDKQLALLGYYEAEPVESDFNEAYGYMRNAEKKAVRDANRLAKRLVNDLGIDPDTIVDKKGKKRKSYAVANIAPAGGDISIYLPLSSEANLYLSIGLAPTYERNASIPLIDRGKGGRWEGDNLEVERIMYRIEQPNANGGERYEFNNFADSDVTYSDLLKDIRRISKKYIPVKEEIGENDKPKDAGNKKKTVFSQTQVADLFGGLFEEEANPEATESQDNELHRKFAMTVKNDMLAALDNGTKPYRSILDLRKRASGLGMEVDNDGRTDILLQELVEDGLVRAAREVVKRHGSDSKETYDLICKLYEMQPTIAARSSNRIKMQQYSTPLPMAWNAVRFAMTGKKDGKVLEPTAGNGMLVFAIPAGQVHANELDGTRLANLREQGFAQVTQQDATEPFEGGKQYDAVVANPPFGKREAVDYDGKLISGLDPQITLNALASMKDDGRAAIIIGGNMEYASNGGLKSMKPFFTYLYDHYNVKGVVDMDGSLYAKQGTTYPTRMILIDGRRSEEERAQSAVYPPVQSKAIRKGDSFEALYDIIEEIINSKEKTNGTEILRSQQGQLLPVADQPSRNADRERHTEQPRKDDAGRPGGRTSVERTQEPGEVVLRGEHRTDIGDGETRRRTGGNTGGGSRGVSEPDVQRVETVGVSTERVGLEPTSTEQPKRRTLTEEKSAYRPHNSAFSLQSVAPAAMVEAMDRTLSLIEKKYGHIDEFVRKELGYDTTDELHQALAAEQVDSVAMAIYQMKQGQALIIGDQTGVGKGRQMAALIRWAVRQGEKPIFITQKADLFSDIYRDLVDIGSGDLVPFIFNSPSAKENKGEMVDANGKVVYKGLSDAKMKKVLATGKLPDECDYAVLTYSQVNTGDEVSQKEMEEAAKKNKTRSKKSKSAKDGKATPKATFLRAIAEDNYLFLDESHTAAGSSNTGAYLQSILRSAKAATFASATFAKRPDTMPLYAIRTAMSQAKVEPDKLISIIEKGGVTLQEIMSRELTNAGQMVRRERDMSDVVTDWKTINDPETVRRARENYDRTIAAFNAIIKFQEDYVKPMVDTMDKELAAMAESAGIKRGTDKMGIDNVPFASKTYNYTKQLMLALKVDAIANEVDTEIKAGRHPVIALESTMESSIKDYSAGEVIVEPTFSASLLRGLDTVMQYTIKDENGKEQHARYSPKQLGEAGEKAYYELQDFIRESTSDIFISPLDAIIERLHEMGYKIGELTGRNMYVERDDKDRVVVKRRTDKDKKRMQREFNNGELDVLILNKSASTGISLHASEKFSDQRQRTMIIAQPLSDINDYMQMIGRIDRTGQVHRGYYINLGLPVPAENRFLMMLSTKLKSLNANTTTSQDSESNEVEAPDLLNKYGSQVVVEYLRDNPDVYDKMGRPLKKNGENGGTVSIAELDEYKPQEDDARKITGYVALLNTQEQEEFYDDVVRRYNELIKYLNDTGNNDLKITVMPLRAKTLEKRVSSEGIDPTGTNPFAQNSYVEQVEMDVLRKPMKAAEIRKTIEQVNKGKRPEDYIRQVISTIEKEDEARIAAEEARYERSKVRAQEDIAKQTEKINRQQKRSAEEKQAAIADYAKETHENVEAKHSDNLVRLNTNSDMLKQRLRMFEVGKSYLMPDNLDTMAFDFSTPAIFCGYKAKDSKITASTTLAVFATLDGRRRVEVKLSDIAALRSIYKTTNDNWDAARSTTLDNWDSQIPTGTRKTGYIMTGNILQAIADTQDERGGFPGQLISYTDIDGNVHDGILMPDKWNRSMLKTSGVPIISRLKQIKDYQPVTSHDGKVEITGSSWAKIYYLAVPKTKKDGSVYYENNAILNAVHGHNFYPYRGKLRADIPAENIESVVKELSKLGVKVQEEAKEDDVLYRLDDYMTNGEEANDLFRIVDDANEIERLNSAPSTIESTREASTIMEDAVREGRYMKAPNGAQSKLDSRQWVQVRTSAFKAWAGDWENDPEHATVVLDENGEPLVVYHGTDAEFTTFDPERGDGAHRGMYFTDSKEMAASYKGGKHLMPVFLNLREVYEFDGRGRNWEDLTLAQPYDRNSGEDVVEHAEKVVRMYQAEVEARRRRGGNADEYAQRLSELRVPRLLSAYRAVESEKPGNVFAAAARLVKMRRLRKEMERYFRSADPELSSGLATRDVDLTHDDRDGIIFRNIRDYGTQVEDDAPHDVYVVYDPNNIKSATGNNGEFSRENNDIMFRDGKNKPNEPKPIGRSIFGNVYNQFKGKVLQAVKFLVNHESGDLLGVFHRNDIGDIDMVWGDEGGGLCHILNKHVNDKDFPSVKDLVSRIEDIINKGEIDERHSNTDKLVLVKDGYLVTIRRNVREKGIKIADKNWVLTAYNKDAPATTKAPVDGTYGSTAVAPGTSSAAKVVESFENSSVEEDNLRDGDGALTDDELSMTNDPVSKVLGKSVRTVQEYKRFAERERARMIAHIQELAEKLHLDNVEIVTDASTLEGRRGKAKGFYSRSTGKITIVIPNHSSVFDAEQTLLHEAVAHYGLRQLFGEHFDTFLDNVFRNAETGIKERISQMEKRLYQADIEERAKQKGGGVFARAEAVTEANEKRRNGDYRKTATEEYLASLAEETNFENTNSSWWSKIKELFLRMLHKIGFENFSGVTLSDNELRYILWRSYENLAEPGRYRSILGEAEDVAKQNELKVGNYTVTDNATRNVAEGRDELYRDGDPEIHERTLARDRYEQRVKRGVYQTQEALQDSMLGLREAMEAILKGEGKKKIRIEDVDGFENAYFGENRLSSVNKAEADAFAHTLFKPLLDEVAKLAPTKEAREELTDYMMAKHGLERNRVMREREKEKLIANSELAKTKPQQPNIDNDDYDLKMDAFDKAMEDWNKQVEDEFGDKFEVIDKRDFAGLTALTDTDNVADAEAEAQQMVNDYESGHDTDTLWKRTNAVSDATLSKLYESGMMSKETYDNIRSMYDYYIPLRGFDEKTGEEAYAYLNSKNSAFNAPIKTAKGRKSKADDPFAYLQSMAESAIVQGNRNKLVKQKFLNFVLNHPSDLASVSDIWLKYNKVADEWKPVFPDNINADDTPSEVERKMQDFEYKMKELAEQDPDLYKHGKDTVNIPYRVVEKRDLRQHQIVVKRGGRDYVITINGNPRAAQALNGQTNPDNDMSGAVGAILKAGERINRELSALYTTRNPDFVVSNFIRDMLYSNSMMWIKESPNYALRFHRNFAKVNPVRMKMLLAKYRKNELDMSNDTERMFHQFMMNGGETGYSNMRDIEKHKNDIRREIRKAGGQLPIRKAWDLLAERLDEVNRGVENCARFAAFMTSREMGRTIDRSIYDAKEISVNFNKKGSGAKFMGATGQTKLGNASAFMSGLGRSGFVFWNAAIQGTANFGRQTKRHPAKALTGLAAMFLLGAIVASLGYGDDDEDDKNNYWNLPEYVRRSNLLFRAGDQWISIPLPVEYRAVYGLGELMTSTLSGKEHFTDGELAGKIAGQVSQLLPLDFMEGGGGFKAFIPSSIKPFAEAYGYKKSWTGLPLYKDTPYNKDMPEWTKAYKSANKYLVDLSETLNEMSGGDQYTKGAVDFNPAQVEYVLNGYFGGIANTINRMTKMGETLIGQREYDPNSFLVLNRILKNGDERTEYKAINNEYFRLKEEHDKLRTRLRNYERDTDNGVFDYAEKIDFLYNSPEYARYEIFESYRSDIDDLYNLLKEANANGDKEAVKDIEAQLKEVKKMMIKDMDATRK
ncbi:MULTISPECIES: LPD38 domain-containing protein [Mediterranea]|uniref:LPD38 domain-containing protein n=1 Tax=Mediterranea TaxID=1926659 RepID=UPI002013733A|nr:MULTISPECIES: LPD38 domain-containing protein [Mediterranea]MCL1606696.1 strawberry notch C-terminal domain-containing protein [Mediterranea sp. ET5]MDM8122742.1 strawberry notch C-terminal domain-containing protein [Mediterranea massiliensis]MDM8197198.1 strawberry notch C-terminal domain-containing protein [Mediterranea massiliensis]